MALPPGQPTSPSRALPGRPVPPLSATHAQSITRGAAHFILLSGFGLGFPLTQAQPARDHPSLSNRDGMEAL